MTPCRVVVLYCVGLVVLLQAERISALRCYGCLFGCNGKFDHESRHVNEEEYCQSCTKIIYNEDVYRFCSQATALSGCSTNETRGTTSCSCYTNLCNGSKGNQTPSLITSLLAGTIGTWRSMRNL